MFGLVYVKWFGFIPKRPKQPHPQLVHWWVLGHSNHAFSGLLSRKTTPTPLKSFLLRRSIHLKGELQIF
jgi:hypothetical protein